VRPAAAFARIVPLDGRRSDYTTAAGAGGFTVTPINGVSAPRSFTAEQRVQFADRVVAFDIEGSGIAGPRLPPVPGRFQPRARPGRAGFSIGMVETQCPKGVCQEQHQSKLRCVQTNSSLSGALSPLTFRPNSPTEEAACFLP